MRWEPFKWVMGINCDACSGDTPCAVHCCDCGIAWQPGFVRVTSDPRGGEQWTLIALYCPTCWDRVAVS